MHEETVSARALPPLPFPPRSILGDIVGPEDGPEETQERGSCTRHFSLWTHRAAAERDAYTAAFYLDHGLLLGAAATAPAEGCAPLC